MLTFRGHLNSYNAFTLSLAAKDDETSLVGSQTSGEIETASGQILGTGESAVVSGKRVSAWGYYVGSSADTSTTFVDVKESDSADTLQTGNLTSGKSETTVYYGVSTGPDLAPDTYTGGVTYTATTANS